VLKVARTVPKDFDEISRNAIVDYVGNSILNRRVDHSRFSPSIGPESIHMTLWIMSDRAIPRSFRFMEGFGVHTFRLVNERGRSTFVKFHWKPKLVFNRSFGTKQ
jgi:hypothetical protein